MQFWPNWTRWKTILKRIVDDVMTYLWTVKPTVESGSGGGSERTALSKPSRMMGSCDWVLGCSIMEGGAPL